MKQFQIPQYYKSSLISTIKNTRKSGDPRKKDFSPTVLDFGPVQFLVARHFGFCYGVENAIEISYRTIEENPNKRIFLLSEMIHNPGVNNDLLSRGVNFIMDTSGKQLIPWSDLRKDDIVIIPAFGITLDIQNKLESIGINAYSFNTTCPFVEKVWNRSAQLGEKNFTVIIHGKDYHEETRATFSHSERNAPSLIIRDLKETELLSEIILNDDEENFYNIFKGKYSTGFSFKEHLQRIGVVNQTTMLASETEAITDLLRNTMIRKYGEENIASHFADTRDTLCYATNDNQDSTYGLISEDADLAIVVGGYNSSNTSHIVELCEEKFPTYFISSEEKLLSANAISHWDLHNKKEVLTENYLPAKTPVRIVLTSGASCPDAVVDAVLQKILTFFPNTRSIEEVLNTITD